MKVPHRVYLFLAVGLIAASQSGNLIRLGQAHPVAIAAWRLLLAAVMLAPFAGRQLTTLKKLEAKEWILLVLAGAALAGHFFAWIGAVQNTTVANAAVFFAVNPILTAAGGYFVFKERFTSKLLISIALGLIGVAVIGGSDLHFSREQIPGDMLALICSVIFTIYFLLGKKLRQRIPTKTYVTVVYGMAAIFSFLTMLLLKLPLVSYARQTWLCFVLMALIPTMLGHTSFNHALQYISAGRISAATLSEPLLAGLVAYFAWGESVSPGVVAGYILICGSILVLALDLRPKAAP